MKNKLKRLVNEIEQDSLRLRPEYSHKFELNNEGKKRICRTEDLLKNPKMENILTAGLLPAFISKVNGKQVTLFKEKINYKYPSTGGYKPHQDITAYPNSRSHITALINLCDTNENNGSIQFSTHYDKSISKIMVLDHNDGVIKNQSKLDWHDPVETKFGDIVLFNSYIPHKSLANSGDFPRKALYLTYTNADEGDKRQDYYNLKNDLLVANKISLINHYDGKIMANNLEHHKQYVVDYILNLYREFGHTMYDKDGSQLDHAFMVMDYAIKQNYSEKFQLSCFLHDIGHLLLDEKNDNDNFLLDDLKHEYCGFRFLKQFLDREITVPIMLHVKAKRYLCTVDDKYYEGLSEASKRSFKIQGGEMDYNQIAMFRNNKYFAQAVKLRELEDTSKKDTSICDTNRLDYIEKLLYKYIFSCDQIKR